MTQDPSLVRETPEGQQETVVAESSTNPRTTGPRAPPPRNLDSDGVCDEYDGGGPDDDEVSLATQAHGLAGGKPFSFLCFSSSKQTRCWPNLCVSLAGIAVACLALRRQMQSLLGLWYRRWSQVLWKRVGADWAGDVVLYIVW